MSKGTVSGRTASGGTTPSDEDTREEALIHLRRNYVAYLCHGLLGQTGMRLVNTPTFIPAYLYALSGSDIVVGLARSVQYLGMFLSPILSATWVEHRRRVLPLAFWVGAAMRLQILGLALAAVVFPEPLVLAAVIGFLGLFGFFLGMQGVIFSTVFAKVIPVERRGVLLGIRNALSGLTAAAAAYFGGRYLVGDEVSENVVGSALREVFGNGFGATFGVAFVLTSVGLLMLTFVREPRPERVRERKRVRDRLRDLPVLLRSDRAFTLYFSARSLATMGRMALPFYFLYASAHTGVDEGTSLGVISLAFLLAQTVSNAVWGWIADRSGFRLVFLAALVVWMVAGIALMPAEGLIGTSLAFAGIGVGLGGFVLASQNMVLEFGERAELPMRIAVANSAAEFTGAIGPLLGGVLVAVGSYATVFWTAIGFQAAAVLVVLFFVDEPRNRARDVAN